MTNPPAEPRLWDFALRVYTRPGVREACLSLQDEHGCDVLMLLWAAWLGAQGHRLTEAERATAEAALAPWRAEVVEPLRTLRRRLKSGPSPAPSDAGAALREQVKAAELAAERIGLDLLEGLLVPRAETGRPVAANLGLVAPAGAPPLLAVLAGQALP